MFAVYHGPGGLRKIADRVHKATLVLAQGLRDSGNTIDSKVFFDTIKVNPSMASSEIRERAKQKEINLRYFDDGGVSYFKEFICFVKYVSHKYISKKLTV